MSGMRIIRPTADERYAHNPSGLLGLTVGVQDPLTVAGHTRQKLPARSDHERFGDVAVQTLLEYVERPVPI
jgi:hypothetical protein